MKTPVKATKEGISLNIYVQPGAAKSAWAGIHDGAFKLRVEARPVEGEANKEVRAYIARFFKVPKSAVTIVHGLTGRNKLVQIAGDTKDLVDAANRLIHSEPAG